MTSNISDIVLDVNKKMMKKDVVGPIDVLVYYVTRPETNCRLQNEFKTEPT